MNPDQLSLVFGTIIGAKSSIFSLGERNTLKIAILDSQIQNIRTKTFIHTGSGAPVE